MVVFTRNTRILLIVAIVSLTFFLTYLYKRHPKTSSNDIATDFGNINFKSYQGIFHLPNSTSHHSFTTSTTTNESASICHIVDDAIKRNGKSKSILLYGATSFLGSKVAIVLHQSGYHMKLIDDLDNIPLEPMAWYRWQKLQELKLNPEYVQMNSIDHIFANHKTDTVVFIPTPLFDGFSNHNQLFKLKIVTKVLKNFVNLLEKAKINIFKVILLSLSRSSDNSIQKSWLRAFELSLSSYQSFGVQTGLVRMDGVYGPWEGQGDDIYPNSTRSCSYIGQVEKALLDVLNVGESCAVVDVSEYCSEQSEAMSATILWAEEHAKFLNNRKDVVISTYFTRPRNPMYNYQIKSRSGLFMKQWFTSAVRHGLNLVIFHDNFDKKFEDRVRKIHPNTEFVRADNLHGRTTNDYRFYLTYQYLLEHPEIRRAVLTDMRDVKFFDDPFNQMDIIGDYLYIGIDVSFYLSAYEHGWLKGVLKRCHRSDAAIDEVKLHPFLNAGVSGGTRHSLLAFLTQMTRYFDKSPHYLNCNMGTISVVGHKHFHDYLYDGYPVQSAFKLGMVGYVPQGQSIKHKDTEKYYY